MTADKALKYLVRARMAATGKPYTVALRDVEIISEVAIGQDLNYAEAVAEYDDPRNQLLCRDCGWTNGMVCPECPKGCGCQIGCSGWRHSEYADPDNFDGLFVVDGEECECGASTEYECVC